MFIRKRYGESKVDRCLFCSKQATTENSQGVPVCAQHKNALLNDMKCICGEYLDLKKGKYGIFFTCMRCGAQSLRKVLEINQVRDVSREAAEKRAKQNSSAASRPHTPTVITVTSDDPRYFD